MFAKLKAFTDELKQIVFELHRLLDRIEALQTNQVAEPSQSDSAP